MQLCRPCEVTGHERARAAEAAYQAIAQKATSARKLLNPAADVDKKIATYKQQQNMDIASACGDVSDMDVSQCSDEELPMSSFAKPSSAPSGSAPRSVTAAVAAKERQRRPEMSPVGSPVARALQQEELEPEEPVHSPADDDNKPARRGRGKDKRGQQKDAQGGRGKDNHGQQKDAQGPRRTAAQTAAATKAEAMYTKKAEAHSPENLWEKKPRQRQVETSKKQLEEAAHKLIGDSQASDLMDKMLKLAEDFTALHGLFSEIRTSTWPLVQEPIEDSRWQVLTNLEYSLVAKIFVYVAGVLLKEFEHPETTATFIKMLAFTSSDKVFGLSVLQTDLEQKNALQLQLLGLWFDRVFRLKDLEQLRAVIAACPAWQWLQYFSSYFNVKILHCTCLSIFKASPGSNE